MFIGVSGPVAVSPAAIRTMAERAIVFAMANPTPEVQPEEIREDVAIMATGRSDSSVFNRRVAAAVTEAVAEAAVAAGVARRARPAGPSEGASDADPA